MCVVAVMVGRCWGISSPQPAAEHGEWGGSEGAVGPRSFGALGQVPLGVLPKRDGTAQKQQHH